MKTLCTIRNLPIWPRYRVLWLSSDKIFELQFNERDQNRKISDFSHSLQTIQPSSRLIVDQLHNGNPDSAEAAIMA